MVEVALEHEQSSTRPPPDTSLVLALALLEGQRRAAGEAFFMFAVVPVLLQAGGERSCRAQLHLVEQSVLFQ